VNRANVATVDGTAPDIGPRRARLLVDDAEEAATVFRDRNWGVLDVRAYLAQLQRSSGVDFSLLIAAGDSSLIYQSGSAHLGSRRAIAGPLAPGAMARWGPVIDAAIDRCLAGLSAAAAPDLVRDFADPLYVTCIREIFGLSIPNDAAFLRDMAQARTFTEPLLRLQQMIAVQDGYRGIIAAVPLPSDIPAASDDRPTTLAAAIAREALPRGVDARILTASLTVAAHTASQSLAFALFGLLADDAPRWPEVAAPNWPDHQLERIIRDFPSTLRLYRVAQGDGALGSRKVRAGDLAMLDIPAINRSLCPHAGAGTARPSMSFGEGMHKCPGAALARLLLRRALPALARRFPELRLVETQARMERTHMVQAPVALPCRLSPAPRRGLTRQWAITDPDVARAIAIDDERFSPPGMEAHLRALQAGSGHDLSTAIRIARNAPFFLSGARHRRIRRLAFEALGGNRLVRWEPWIDHALGQALASLSSAAEPDLVRDFCEPLFRTTCQPILGIHPRNADGFDRLAPLLQEVLEPLRSMRAILRVQAFFDTLIGQFDETSAMTGQYPPSLLSHLAAHGGPGLDEIDRRAAALVFYGASFNVAHTLANALIAMGSAPIGQRQGFDDPAWMFQHLDRAIVPAAASPRFIYRQAKIAGEVGGCPFAAGDTMQLQLGAINAGLGAGHLAFGHGLHRCPGASLSRLLLRKAIPALFGAFPELTLDAGVTRYDDNSQTIIPNAAPCRLDRTTSPEPIENIHA
jgi:cytochrome P450